MLISALALAWLVILVIGWPGWQWLRRKGRLLALLPLLLPGVLQAQFTYETNNGTITITKYTGSGGAVTIPGSINGLPVTSIGDSAFLYNASLTSIVIPDGVTNVGDAAFAVCSYMTNATLGSGVIRIGSRAFSDCARLAEITIPDTVTTVGDFAFAYCDVLTNLIVGHGVTNIADKAFSGCASLTRVHFQGNRPVVGPDTFLDTSNVTVYYLPGTTGWGPTLGGRPTSFWALPYPVILTTGPSFGVQDGPFGFVISWAANFPSWLKPAQT